MRGLKTASAEDNKSASGIKTSRAGMTDSNIQEESSLRRRHGGATGKQSVHVHHADNPVLYSESSWIDIFRTLLQESGINGLYLGIETKLFQSMLTSAVMFVCYEYFVHILF
jgi:hypothetical protein